MYSARVGIGSSGSGASASNYEYQGAWDGRRRRGGGTCESACGLHSSRLAAHLRDETGEARQTTVTVPFEPRRTHRHWQHRERWAWLHRRQYRCSAVWCADVWQCNQDASATRWLVAPKHMNGTNASRSTTSVALLPFASSSVLCSIHHCACYTNRTTCGCVAPRQYTYSRGGINSAAGPERLFGIPRRLNPMPPGSRSRPCASLGTCDAHVVRKRRACMR